MGCLLGHNSAKDNLQKCWIIGTEWCCIRRRSGETMDHLLLVHCEVARALGWVFQNSWVSFGNAWEGGRGYCILENPSRYSTCCYNLEDGSHLQFMVDFEGKKRMVFQDWECSLKDPKSFFFNMLFLRTVAVDLMGLLFMVFLDPSPP